MTSIAIVYHSGYGHTEKQAQAVRDGAIEAGAEVRLLKAADLASPESGPWDVLEAADAIVFGAPTYMGSVAAPFEAFADATSKPWHAQKWKDKLAAGFTCSSGLAGDKSATLLRMATLAAQHGMLWVGLGLPPGTPDHPGDDAENLNRLGYFLGAGAQAGATEGPDVAPRASDLATAKFLGARVAGFAAKLAG